MPSLHACNPLIRITYPPLQMYHMHTCEFNLIRDFRPFFFRRAFCPAPENGFPPENYYDLHDDSCHKLHLVHGNKKPLIPEITTKKELI